MPNQKDQDLAEVWSDKIKRADIAHSNWEDVFQVKDLELYEEGFQVAENTNAYVLNLFNATIEVKTPSLRFSRPVFTIKPSPAILGELGEDAYEITRNLEDTINTWSSDAKNNFAQELISCIDDAWSRFGIMEVGYSANWIDNPKLAKPIQKSDYKPGVDKRRMRSSRSESPLIPEDEKIFVRSIPGERFRVSEDSSHELWQCDWCGYYDYIRIEDLLALPQLRNKQEVAQSAGKIDFDETEYDEYPMLGLFSEEEEEPIKFWKIYDIRSRQILYFINNGDVLFWKQSYETFPFVDIRFKRRKKAKGFYPLPYTFNWLSPQNEINEVRNAHRDHRRRFKRIYTANKNAFEDMTTEDLQNVLINGPDGSVMLANRDAPIQAVPNADLGSSAHLSMQVTLDDFNRISGTTSEMRGESDRTTATQAALTNERARVRESKEKTIVAEFAQSVAKKVLTFHQRNLVNTFAVTSPPPEQFFGNVNNQAIVKYIDPLIDLGDDEFDYSLFIQLSSLSVIAEEEEKRKFVEFLTLLNQFPQFSISPTLIRELAYRVGYFNEAVLGEFQQLAQLQMLGLFQQLGAVQGGGGQLGEGASQQRLAQMAPNTQEQIRNQLRQQVT